MASLRVLIRDGEELIDSHVFEGQTITIGSDEECHVYIRDRRLLPQQATLSPVEDGSWVITSDKLGEQMYLNGRPVLEPTAVRHNDEITVASYTIAIYGTGEVAGVDSSLEQAVVPAEAERLRALSVPSGSTVKTAAQSLTISGDATCRLSGWAQSLRSCIDIPGLIDFTLDLLQDRFAARLVHAGSRRNDYGSLEFVLSRMADGLTDKNPQMVDMFRFRCLDRAESVCVRDFSDGEVTSAIAAPLTCGRGQLGMVYVDRAVGTPVFTDADLDELTLMAGLVGSQLEQIADIQVAVQESVAAGGLSFVRKIQERMDPTNVPQWAGFQLAVYCKPGVRRSGDVYDIMRLPNGLASFLVATVEGEAIRSAVAMAEARTAFRVSGLHADAPHVFLRGINWLLCDDRHECRMRTVALVMNPMTGEIEYGTAGDCGAAIVDARGDLRVLHDPSAPAVGESPGFGYTPRFDRLGAGETLVLYSLGCESVLNEAGDALGRENLLESLRDGFGQSASVALDELLRDHSSFFKDGNPVDDITILLFHRTRDGS